MLRSAILVLSAALLAAALAGTLLGWPTFPFAVPPALLMFGLLFERYVYKPVRSEPPGAGWDRTQEKFIDSGSGQSVIVYYNPRTGERRYVAESGADGDL